jgi:hypothetical protein
MLTQLYVLIYVVISLFFIQLPHVNETVERLPIGAYNSVYFVINSVTVIFFLYVTIRNARSVVSIIDQPLLYILYTYILMFCLVVAIPTSIYNNMGMFVFLAYQAVSVAVGSFLGVVWSYVKRY